MRSSLVNLAFVAVLVGVCGLRVNGDSVTDDYMQRLGDSASYEVFKELHSEVFARDDLTLEQKKAISQGIVEGWNANVDAEYHAATAELWTRGTAAILLKGLGNQLWMPGFLGGALDAWGDGILKEKGANDIVTDMMIGGTVSGLTPVLLKSGGKWVVQLIRKNPTGDLIVEKIIKVSDDVAAKTAKKIEDSKIGKTVFKNVNAMREQIQKELKSEADTLAKGYKELLRTPDSKLTPFQVELKQSVLAKILKNKEEIRMLKSGRAVDGEVAKENILKDLAELVGGSKALENLAQKVENLGRSTVGLDNARITQWLRDTGLGNWVYDIVSEVYDSAGKNSQIDQSSAKLQEYISDTDYKVTVSQDGQVVLESRVVENVYIDNSTGEVIQIGDGEIPANILDAVFNDDPAEPKDAQTLANEAFDKEIDKIVKDIADGDESLAQKIKDFVKGKIDEAIKKGEDWIENGGIRKTILEQVDKMLEGKVSTEDAQRIHNLVDTLCNVNKDGGESFLNTLGTDGKDLAVSLAVEALKKQLSDALPEDAADMVNAMLDVLKDKGTADDYKKAVLGQIQELITKYVPYENTANSLNKIIQDIVDGNAIDVMDSIKDVGKNLGVDLLKDTISKNLDPELANRINALLDGFAKNGMQGVTEEALAQVYALIDQYAPGADSAQKIKDIIKGTLNGTVTATDLKDAATSIVTDGAKKLINDSNLPQGVKDLANTAIDGLSENGITGMTENVGDFIEDYVTDQLGEEAGDAVREIYDAIVTPGQDVWETIVKEAPTIGKAIGQKVLKWVEGKIAEQIDKLIAKYPALKSILDRLGITGKGIVQGVKNVLSVLWNAASLKDAIKTLANMAKTFFKNILGKLIDIGLEYAFNWLASNLVPKVVDWATAKLQKWADSAKNPLVKKGLEWLAGQVSNCKKCASMKIKVSGVGEKIVTGLGKIIEKRKEGKVHVETK